ncbi:hypothetical protein [Campylobacter avium]|uniref:hypothetical protein n=1 Tax=Campylobacter avium TaxID=522485 RepID=UPI0023541004|nr:hypothetical protein [Campylobacter avium]
MTFLSFLKNLIKRSAMNTIDKLYFKIYTLIIVAIFSLILFICIKDSYAEFTFLFILIVSVLGFFNTMKDINNYKELIEKQENKIKQREKEY